MAKKKKGNQAPVPPAGEPDDAPGWHAIDVACERIYPDQPDPVHAASAPHPPFGDGLIYGISAYRATEGAPHWHFVTYGFSELYAKESDAPDMSGWGFELTFRLARGTEELPPNWAINFLMNLGKYVRRFGNAFDSGHLMDLNGPIALGTDTAIRAIAFVPDPQLGTIDTPNGSVKFLQIVGLTSDEHAACGDWHTTPVLNLLRGANPLLLTDLDRRSALETPSVAEQVQTGIDREGSQTPLIFVTFVEWETAGKGASRTAVLVLGARGVQALVPKLRSRLAHGRDFRLIGREQAVNFCARDTPGWKTDDTVLTIDLTPTALAAVRANLQPVRGRYTWPELPNFVLAVQPSNITDADGNVIDVIG
ncbi:Suppressor of fused protein (SUFU) [Gemmata sp. SH-PL17]|uniref:suppressor of fused domain protein n=1 Tax=Gemmata sp. SH-PL17 TaxID=1630693 RepID=UPI0004B8D2DF|nr:suppressor of fused domain protein [Gemmata sp. SH-PL17]AMV29800.1 Suppressor of fused protein (SUFU) [Gemmata sp. SH-PL17]